MLMAFVNDLQIPYSNKKTPQAYFGSKIKGRFREVSVNPLSNRAYFTNDVYSCIHVCDLSKGDILFTFSKRVRYPVSVHAKGQVVIICNYDSSNITFYTLEGDLISEYGMGFKMLGLTMDSKGGLNVSSSENHCVVEMDGMEVNVRGVGWLDLPSKIVSGGELLYILDSVDSCCRVMREGQPLRKLVKYSSRQVSIPSGICVDASGNILISDSGRGGILVFGPDGEFLHEMKQFGDYDVRAMKNIGGIDLDPRGDIVVTCQLNDKSFAFLI